MTPDHSERRGRTGGGGGMKERSADRGRREGIWLSCVLSQPTNRPLWNPVRVQRAPAGSNQRSKSSMSRTLRFIVRLLSPCQPFTPGPAGNGFLPVLITVNRRCASGILFVCGLLWSSVCPPSPVLCFKLLIHLLHMFSRFHPKRFPYVDNKEHLFFPSAVFLYFGLFSALLAPLAPLPSSILAYLLRGPWEICALLSVFLFSRVIPDKYVPLETTCTSHGAGLADGHWETPEQALSHKSPA